MGFTITHPKVLPGPDDDDPNIVSPTDWNIAHTLTGTADASQLNANVVQGVVNDTNVTGSIAAQVLTFGWTGTLAVARGGTGGGSASGTLLDNITGFASTGQLVRTAAGAYAFRTLTAPAAGITVSNGDGVAGNPTLVLANDLAALEALSGTSTQYYRSGADTWSTVTYGTGVTFSGGALAVATWNNARLAKTASYTVVNGDKGKTLALSSGGQTLTISAASGYDSDFQIVAHNEDTTRAWKIAPNGLTSFFIYPGQTARIFNQNNVWKVDREKRWQLTGTGNLFVDVTNGNDSNDGLASGSGNAFATITKAIAVVNGILDLNANPVLISLADGNYTENISLLPYIGRANQGHTTGPVMIQGNAGAITNVSLQPASGDAITAVETGGFEWGFQNLKIAPPAGNGIVIDQGSWVCLNTGITFGATTQNHIVVENNGFFEPLVAYTIAGGAASHLLIHDEGKALYGGQTVTLTGTPAFSGGFIQCVRRGAIQALGVTFSGAATGTRWSRDASSYFGISASADSVFPGNSNGSVSPVWAISEGGTGGATVAQAQAALFICFPPQGRVTLSTATPVMTATVSGATTVYYTPDQGRFVPIYNGTSFVMTDTGGEISQATTDATKSPAAVAASKVYDIFVWNDSGTIRATRGPAWTSSTARGTGAGTSELQLLNGFLTNKVAVTNGPGANLGTYVGSIASNGSSTIDFIYGAAVTAASFNVWNMYNRRNIGTTVIDTAASYQYTSATIRQKRGNASNQIGFLLGQPEEAVQGFIKIRIDTVAALNANIQVGFGYDTITSLSGRSTLVLDNVAAAGRTEVAGLPTQWSPGLGTHILSSNEQGDGTNANTVNLGSIDELNAVIRM